MIDAFSSGMQRERVGAVAASDGPRRRLTSWTLAALLVIALALTGCGSSSSGASSGGSGGGAPAHVHFAKTKFLLHAGLAFGAFHRYIYKPFRSGGFTPPLSHKLALVKAGAAALFVYHEVKIALVDARSSPLLSKLVNPLTALQSKLGGLRQGLQGGRLNSAGINQAEGAVSGIESTSAHSGASIKELATSAIGG